jgi:hypothetical protein
LIVVDYYLLLFCNEVIYIFHIFFTPCKIFSRIGYSRYIGFWLCKVASENAEIYVNVVIVTFVFTLRVFMIRTLGNKINSL